MKWNISGFGVCFLLVGAILEFSACSTTISLTVTTSPKLLSQTGVPLNFHLLDQQNYQNLNTVIDANYDYYRKKSAALRDSLLLIKRQFDMSYNEYLHVEESCSTTALQLPLSYCKNITVNPIAIQKTGNYWQIWAEVNNGGNEKIDGVVISVDCLNNRIVEKLRCSIPVNPGEKEIFKKLYLDLSNDLPLQYSMASYPGGLNKLLEEGIKITIDTTLSTFTKSTKECRRQLGKLSQELYDLELQYDNRLEQGADYLDQAVILPANKIIESKLQELSFKHSSIMKPDTVTFTQLEKGRYNLLVYHTAENDAYQWVLPLDISGNTLISLASYRPTTFFMTEKKLKIQLPKLEPK
jgi:hypothetical protein